MYVDLLLSFNLAVNYFLLHITAVITGRKAQVLRTFLSALLGAVFLLLLLFYDEPSSLINIIGKILLPLFMVLLAFNPKHLSEGFILFFVFYLSSLVLGGVILLFTLWEGSRPQDITQVYFITAPSTMYFLISGIFLYGLAFLIPKYVNEKLKFNRLSENLYLELSMEGKTKTLSAFLDTGNMLKDPFTGKDVAVAKYSAVKELLPAQAFRLLDMDKDKRWEQLEDLYYSSSSNTCSFLLIPYKTIQGEGLMPAFKPDSIALWFKGKKFTLPGDLVIGIPQEGFSDFECDLLLPMDIYEKVEKL